MIGYRILNMEYGEGGWIRMRIKFKVKGGWMLRGNGEW
jgi:hypothetical protein